MTIARSSHSAGKRSSRRTAAFARHARPVAIPGLVDIDEIADRLGVTVRHVRRLVAERRIPYLKWGHLLRFDPDEVVAWLDDAHVDPVFYGRRASGGNRRT